MEKLESELKLTRRQILSSVERMTRIILESSVIEVIHKTKYDGETTLCSSLRGVGGCKSSISNLDAFDLLKDKTRFESSSTFSIAAISAAKNLAKITKEVDLGVNPKSEGEKYSPKEGPSELFP